MLKNYLFRLSAIYLYGCAQHDYLPARFQGHWDTDPAACREQTAALTVEMTGEGERWVSSITYHLSNDGNKLTEHFEVGGSFERVRCHTVH